ncbi:sigma-54 dependent transcriptional regulator [Pollutibacter soli]|uniref:sigma-54-dependent transcriptional regulator n=1 Tax=Pollutibacter soli TaxID=3034157 RepID=UPI0030138692
MKKKILIVEDQFIEANNLQMILERAGYTVTGIARSVPLALEIIENEIPDLVLLDIFLQGNLTGIDLARRLNERSIGFVYLSANSNKKTLDEAKVTRPYGFLVKPFREKDVLVTLDIAWYLHEQHIESNRSRIISEVLTTRIPEFKNIIGESASWKKVLEQVLTVARTETSVLLLGESGTGKEKIAEAIHHISPRAQKPFIKTNCAALPFTLIESELFGHERGAFTGAADRRIGRFESADGGTIFLDEIGEIPLETQAKLLRVLQEKEIERLGGGTPIKVNIRIIAATNRNLEKEVAENRFRLDLYYRLNVFPLVLPSLRERKDDIPLLVNYFMKQFAKRVGREIQSVTAHAMNQLVNYSWPGNIRELENIMERTILLARGAVIEEVILPENKVIGIPGTSPPVIKTIEENERDHIVEILKQCNGKISGEGGAAELLNINVSTLNSKIKKLGILKEHYYVITRHNS